MSTEGESDADPCIRWRCHDRVHRRLRYSSRSVRRVRTHCRVAAHLAGEVSAIKGIPVKSKYETKTRVVSRDGGGSVALPDGHDLWLFGDTGIFQRAGNGPWKSTALHRRQHRDAHEDDQGRGPVGRRSARRRAEAVHPDAEERVPAERQREEVQPTDRGLPGPLADRRRDAVASRK